MSSNEVVDEVARAMFPGSEWMEEVVAWLNGWKAQGTVRGAVRIVKETIRRYQRLVNRHGRGAIVTETQKKKWLVRKLPPAPRQAVFHLYDSWSWDYLVSSLLSQEPAESAANPPAATSWASRLEQARTPEPPRQPHLGGVMTVIAPESDLPGDSHPPTHPQAAVAITAPQQQQPSPQFLSAPLAQAPNPHYHASQQQQADAFRQTQQGGQQRENRAQHRWSGNIGEGQQRQQGAPQAPQQAPLDVYGQPLPLCGLCNKHHKGRCWKCEHCNMVVDCTCPLPKLCLKCGRVTHTTEQCNKQEGGYQGQRGNGQGGGFQGQHGNNQGGGYQGQRGNNQGGYQGQRGNNQGGYQGQRGNNQGGYQGQQGGQQQAGGFQQGSQGQQAGQPVARGQQQDGMVVTIRPDVNATHADINRIRDRIMKAAEEEMRVSASPPARPAQPVDPATAATGVPVPAPNAAWHVHAPTSVPADAPRAQSTTDPPPDLPSYAAGPRRAQ
eukprot:GHVU01153876.1.p1 GENE.GHVU01153876.1~~GHVU01153876.1.p1  ORF type:complete len:519 (-),score=64.76 GHVU01153876.1:348-1832(-)